MNAHTAQMTARRRKGLTLIAIAVGVAAIAWGGWHWLHGRHQ